LEAKPRPPSQALLKETTDFKLLKTYMRPKKSCFTQGIYLEKEEENVSVMETCGLFDESYIRRFYLSNEETTVPPILEKHKVDGQIFLEGIATIKDKFWTLTWKNNKILVYDKKTWGKAKKPEKELDWPFGQGWGLTTDGCKFFANTGEDFILHIDEDGNEIKRVSVELRGEPLMQMNDMIYITPYLWVNVWYTDMVYRINPDTGIISKFFDMSKQIDYNWKRKIQMGNTPNGLAYLFEKNPNSMFLTGKRWPSIYELEFDQETICGEMLDDGNEKICASAPKSPCWSGKKPQDEEVESKEEAPSTTTGTTTKKEPEFKKDHEKKEEKLWKIEPHAKAESSAKVINTEEARGEATGILIIFAAIFLSFTLLSVISFCLSSRR